MNVTQQKPYYIAATHASRVFWFTFFSLLFVLILNNLISFKVHIYENETKKVLKSFSFSENAYSASFRDDGKLMCIGFESNNVKVYPLLLSDQKQDQELIEEMDDDESNNTGSAANVPKKRALRTFSDHLGYAHINSLIKLLSRCIK